MMAIIPVKLSNTDLEKIDSLIALGKFKNRSQALRQMLHEKLEEHPFPLQFDTPEDRKNRENLIKEALSRSNFKMEIVSKKTASEIVGTQRDRDR